jgi:hypothetical protein
MLRNPGGAIDDAGEIPRHRNGGGGLPCLVVLLFGGDIEGSRRSMTRATMTSFQIYISATIAKSHNALNWMERAYLHLVWHGPVLLPTTGPRLGWIFEQSPNVLVALSPLVLFPECTPRFVRATNWPITPLEVWRIGNNSVHKHFRNASNTTYSTMLPRDMRLSRGSRFPGFCHTSTYSWKVKAFW